MKIQTSKTAIILLSEVIKEIRVFLKPILIDAIDNLFDKGNYSIFYNNNGIFRKDANGEYVDLKNIFAMWCDYCSEKFFNEHPEFDDVICEINTPKHKDLYHREWLASRVEKPVSQKSDEKTAQAA